MAIESVSTTSPSPVPFHGQTLFVIEKDGQPFAPIKPIVEGMGMAWQTQHRKLIGETNRWGITIMVIPSGGGDQDTMCIPIRKLPAWMASIHPKKVKPEIRDRVILYQNECDDALWNYWSKGRAERITTTAPVTPELPTKESRKLLNRLISVWVGLAPLSYKDAWTQVHARIGVASIEDMTNNNIKAALVYVQERIDASQVQTQQQQASIPAAAATNEIPVENVKPISMFAQNGFNAYQEIEAFKTYLDTILDSVKSDRLDGVRALLPKLQRPLDELRECYLGVLVGCAIVKANKRGRRKAILA